MTRLASRFAFERAVERARARGHERRSHVLVCCGTGCLANGAAPVADAFAEAIAADGLAASLGLFEKRTGCHGFCERGPLVVIQPAGILYTKVKPKTVRTIVERTIKKGEVIHRRA